jgi:hypothetical protein
MQQWVTIAAPRLDAVRALLIAQAAPRIPRIRLYTRIVASAQLSELVNGIIKNEFSSYDTIHETQILSKLKKRAGRFYQLMREKFPL